MTVWVLYVSMEHNNATMATLTEHLSAADNTDESFEGAAKITHIQNGAGVWQIDGGDDLEEDPDEYRVECSRCGAEFGSWGTATRHVADHDSTPTVNGCELDGVVGVANAFEYLDEPHNAGDIAVRSSEDSVIIKSRQSYFSHMYSLLEAQKQGHISIRLIAVGINRDGDSCLRIEVVGGDA